MTKKSTLKVALFLAVLLFSYIGFCAAQNPWPLVKTPSKQTLNIIGSYSAGCIAGASELPLQGPGFQVMRTSRNRYFGHPVLLTFLEDLSSKTQNIGGILIGDLAQPRGGPTGSLHISHQTGLDVDVWYDQAPAGKIYSLKERETVSARSFIADNEKSVNNFWTKNQSSILRHAAAWPETERIFVAPAIKKHMCEQYPHEAFLNHLRPWYGHADHFHVRLKCPPGYKDCKVQDPVPPGDGCAEADEWLTDAAIEARRQEALKPSPPFVMPTLPDLCKNVLSAP